MDISKDITAIIKAVVVGLIAFIIALFFDRVSIKRTPYLKAVIVILFLILHGYALYVASWGVSRFGLPGAVSALGWFLLLVFGFLLFYSLVIELPFGKTYAQTGIPERLVTTGTYALTRHPVVLWYTVVLVSLIIVTKSMVLLVVAPFWALFDLFYAVAQDRFYFVKMFPGYLIYRQRTPMLIPTRKSMAACYETIRQPASRKGE